MTVHRSDFIDCDLLVIGRGMTGMAASLFAADRGLSTVQVGMTGGLIFASGLLDLLGVYPLNDTKLWTDPWAGIDHLVKEIPNHPYARLKREDIEGAFQEGTPDGELFPPKLDEAAAVGLGRKELLRAIMRRRGQRDKPYLEETLSTDLYYYPYWAYYFERRRGRLDMAVLDAVTREKGGAKTRAGILSALVGSGKTVQSPAGEASSKSG